MNRIALDLNYEVKQVFRSLSKYKREKVPAVAERIEVYVEGVRLHGDNVFESEAFFTSLTREGTFPMFNCTCGIFGCGGYEVSVRHEDGRVRWDTEGLTFVFERGEMLGFAEELLAGLERLDRVLASHGLPPRYDNPSYISLIQQFAEGRLSS
ncbi:hypothetical protein [Paenibacillus xanthanilyticus]|uniref:Uncharacterized protein n=1 Tax=Paenibacillus xanthanilyticus TaxID=1783531 RepID=A0ABV8KB31_9BACL